MIRAALVLSSALVTLSLLPAQPAPAERTAVAGNGRGTLKGRVVYDGDPPERPELSALLEHRDRDHCKKGDTRDPTWEVDRKTKGVANAVVYLKAPAGQF